MQQIIQQQQHLQQHVQEDDRHAAADYARALHGKCDISASSASGGGNGGICTGAGSVSATYGLNGNNSGGLGESPSLEAMRTELGALRTDMYMTRLMLSGVYTAQCETLSLLRSLANAAGAGGVGAARGSVVTACAGTSGSLGTCAGGVAGSDNVQPCGYDAAAHAGGTNGSAHDVGEEIERDAKDSVAGGA